MAYNSGGSTVARPTRKAKPVKAITLTAIVTFVATALGQYAIGRVADQALIPLTADVEVEMSTPLNVDGSVLVPPTTTIPGGPVPQYPDLVNRWAVNSGGGPANFAQTSLTVWGRVDRPIILSGLRATNVRCQAAPPWTYIHVWGGGDVLERRLRINLDSGDTDAIPVENAVTGKKFSFPLQVSKSDVEVFSIDIAVAKSDCTYQLELGYQQSGSVKYIPVGTGPYRLTSSSNAARHFNWVPTGPEAEYQVKLEPCPIPCSD